MDISSLTLRDLEYLIAVAKYKHFGKAARAVHVSQPALSGQIKKVEEFLNVQLFERTNRSVMTTPLGEKISVQAQVVLEEAEKIIKIARHNQEVFAGPLRLGAIATLGPYYLPHIIAPLRKKFPDLEIHFQEGLTEGLISDLKKGNLDAVLASPTFTDETLQSFALFTEPFLLAAPKGHPLMSQTTLRSLDLRASDMILLEDGHCLKDQTLQICPSNRRGNIRQYHATSLETLRHLVASGLGYTLMPLLAATEDPRLQHLVTYRPFEGKVVGRDIVLVWRKRFPRPDHMKTLGEFLKQNRPDGTLKA